MTTRTARTGRSNPHTHASTNTTARRAATRLNSADFAPFGDVISAREAEVRGLRGVDANQGSATKWVDVTNIHDFYGECASGERAKVVVNMFVCRPRELEERDRGRMVFPVKILERHPFTAQMFVPVGVSAQDTTVRYLVIVAPTLSTSGDDSSTSTSASASSISASASASSGPVRKGPGLPDLDNVKAFLATGDQAVCYGAGTWHAPMVVLGEKPIDFVAVQYSNGVGEEDCQEFEIDANTDLAIDVDGVEGLKSKL